MKIAICINGNPYQYKTYHQTWLRLARSFEKIHYIADNNFSVDVFIHTWNFDIKNNNVEFLSQNDIEEYIRFMNPKLHVIDDYERYKKRSGVIKGGYLYSMLVAGHLKRTFELEHNFEYDICINLNTTIFISEEDNNRIMDSISIPEKKTIYPAISKYIEYFPHDSVSSQFYYSDSQSFDILTSLYSFISHFKTYPFKDNSDVNEMFSYLIRIFDIKVQRLNLDIHSKSRLL